MPIFSLLIGAVILVLLVLLAVVGLVVGQMLWSAFCVGLVYLLRPAGRRAKWIVVLLPIFPPVFAVWLAVLVWWAWPDKQDAYYAAFGMPPGPTVTVHDGSADGFADSLTIELHFTASQADLQAITAQGLTLDPNYAANHAASTHPNHAGALNGVPLAGKDIYTGGSAHQQYASEDAVLIVDSATGEAWYWFVGVD